MTDTVLHIKNEIEHLVFNLGIKVSRQREVGLLRDGRLLVLEEDKEGNIVSISLN